MKKVAFIVQRCGPEVNGGAELHCFQAALRMSRHWETEILTTCALDYVSWANHYPAGIEHVEGITIRRFPVDQPRDIKKFNRLSEDIHRRLHTVSMEEQHAWMRAQGPLSPALAEYVTQHKNHYDRFIFFTYLYATTYFILPLVREKAWLVPTAHDEWPIYLSMWQSFFTLPKVFLFNTIEERDFLKRLFAHAALEGPIAGVGIEPQGPISPEAFRTDYNIHDPFLLYVGRIDASKGCEALFRCFIELKHRYPSPLKLILLGKAVMPIPAHPDIISLGFVDDRTKWNALAGCEWLVNPSPHESLSMVVLEAWRTRKPVLVTQACDVLVGQCRRANGGLWYDNYAEFEYIINNIDDSIKQSLGRRGYAYVMEHYTWEAIEKIYLEVAEKPSAPYSS